VGRSRVFADPEDLLTGGSTMTYRSGAAKVRDVSDSINGESWSLDSSIDGVHGIRKDKDEEKK